MKSISDRQTGSYGPPDTDIVVLVTHNGTQYDGMDDEVGK